jgi:AmpE protein
MSFLVILLALLIEKFTDWRRDVQQDAPWLKLLRWAEKGRIGAVSPALALLVVVLLPVLLLGGLLLALQPLAYGWLSLPLHLLVLLYSLGRGHAKRELGAFRDAWRRGDEEAAALAAERDLGLVAETPRGLLQAVQAHLLWQGHQGFYAVIFWYLLLGPLAALAYRLLALAEQHAAGEALRDHAQHLRHGFDWLPVRLLAASFGLVGNFVAVNRSLLPELLNWHLPARQLLAEAGPAAADLREASEGEAGIERLDNLSALLVRTRVLWYAVIAAGTLLA